MMGASMSSETDQNVMVEVQHLTKAYGRSAPAIKDISLSFKKGEFVVLLGPSGVGKSTLLRCLNFLVRPTKGDVIIFFHLEGSRHLQDGKI